MVRFFGYTVEWYGRGYRPNYQRSPFIEVFTQSGYVVWSAIWIGDRIRIGRKR